MTASVSAETALTLDAIARTGIARARAVKVPRGVEILLLAAAILVAPLAFVVGLAIFALRHYRRPAAR